MRSEPINESDVMLASASNAIIVGFNVRPTNGASDAAEDAGVDLRMYRVIYDAIEDIEKAMKGMLEPTFREEVTGHVEIRTTFKVSGVGIYWRGICFGWQNQKRQLGAFCQRRYCYTRR